MEARFSYFEKSLEEAKESNRKLSESHAEMNDNVKDKVKTSETELKNSEEKRERLETQSRRENLRFHGIPEDSVKTWEDTEENK